MRWEVFVSRGCNTGGGEVILEYLSRMEVLPTFLQHHQKESGYSGRWSLGGLEVKRKSNFYFCAKCLITSSWSLFFEGDFTKYGGLLMMMTGSNVFSHNARK